MVKERKWFTSKLEAVVAEKADVVGLCRELSGFYEFVGYLHIVSDDGQKELYEITLRDENGYLGNAITKSDNVINQIDRIMEVLADEPRGAWAIGFKEKRTSKGNNFIDVLCTTVNANAANRIEGQEHTED